MIDIWRPGWKYSLLIGSCIAVCYGWLMTLIGLKLTLRGVSYCLLGRLKVEGVTGYLMGPIRVEQCSYQGKTHQWTLAHLTVDWHKRALLRGKWHIHHLRVARLTIRSQTNDYTIPNISRLLERFHIEQAEIQAIEFKTADWTLRAHGSIGSQETLQWNAEGCGLRLQGTLITDWSNGPYIQLMAHSTPTLVWQKQIPALQITAQYQKSRWLSHLTTADSRQPSNDIRLCARVSHTLFNPSSIELQLDARLEDFYRLQSMGFPIEDYLLPHLAGAMTIGLRLQSTFKQLTACIQHPERYFRKYAKHRLPLTAQLSIDWKNPQLLPWGSFSQGTIQGKLHHNRIVWEAQLAESLSSPKIAPAQWRLVGDTRYSFDQTKHSSTKLSLWDCFHAVTRLTLHGDSVALFSGTNYALSASPAVNITIQNRHIQVRGQAYISPGHFRLTLPPPSMTPDLDICFVQSGHRLRSVRWPLDVQLNLDLGSNVYLYYSGLKARLAGSLIIKKKDKQPILAKGEVNLVEGDYYYFGQALQLAPQSRLIFTERLYNPKIDIEASRAISIKPSNRVLAILPLRSAIKDAPSFAYPTTDALLPRRATIGVHLRGDLEAPSMHLFSKAPSWITDPADNLSYMITGQPVHSLHGAFIPLLLNAAAQLSRGYMDHYDVLSDCYKRFGIIIDLQSEELSRNTHFILSKRLTPQMTMLWKEGLIEADRQVGVNYLISENLLMSANINLSHAASGLEFIYQREWG